MKVFVVLEQEYTSTMVEYDCNVFYTEQEAKDYMEERVIQMNAYIEGSSILRDGDEEFNRDCDVAVENGEEWWESKIVKKVVKGE